MVLGRKKQPVRKFYVKIEKQSKEEIVEALKKKKSWSKRWGKPAGLIVKGKSIIPTNSKTRLYKT